MEPNKIMTSQFVFLYVPAATESNASEIAKSLVEDKLAVCVNIIPNITSFYMWEGNLENAPELILIIKTTKQLVAQAKDAIMLKHEYDVPCIAEIDIASLNTAYETWAKSQLNMTNKAGS